MCSALPFTSWLAAQDASLAQPPTSTHSLATPHPPHPSPPLATERFKDRLVDEGYNPAYGARPLRRAIMRLLEDSMAERMLAGDIKEGDSVIIDGERRAALRCACWLCFTRAWPVMCHSLADRARLLPCRTPADRPPLLPSALQLTPTARSACSTATRRW